MTPFVCEYNNRLSAGFLSLYQSSFKQHDSKRNRQWLKSATPTIGGSFAKINWQRQGLRVSCFFIFSPLKCICITFLIFYSSLFVKGKKDLKMFFSKHCHCSQTFYFRQSRDMHCHFERKINKFLKSRFLPPLAQLGLKLSIFDRFFSTYYHSGLSVCVSKYVGGIYSIICAQSSYDSRLRLVLQ